MLFRDQLWYFWDRLLDFWDIALQGRQPRRICRLHPEEIDRKGLGKPLRSLLSLPKTAALERACYSHSVIDLPDVQIL
jgi:hypothetical protein